MRHFGRFCILSALLVGCATQPNQPSAVAVPIPTPEQSLTPELTMAAAPSTAPVAAASSSGDTITAGIQATVDRYAAVVRAKQNDQIATLVDTNGPPSVRRLMVDLAESYQDLSTSDLQLNFRLRQWKQRMPGLVEVTVQRVWDERLHLWLFREHNGAWLFTGPSNTELGATLTVTEGPIHLTYRAWDKDLATALLPQLAAGVQHVHSTLGVPPIATINVFLNAELSASSTLQKGEYQHGVSPASDAIKLITSGSAFGSYYPWKSFVQSVATVFRHEYTHRLNDRSATLVPIDALPTWMSEGLAEHVAGEDHLAVPAFRALAANNKLMSVCELVAPAEKVPVGILYGTAQQVTTYIVDVKGGLPTFWQLAKAYRQSSGRLAQRMELALQKTFGQSCHDFDREWHAWSHEHATMWQPPR